ncbi:MAG TPA: UdgX family uracil-DNA binding protein [Actinomycetota bacterium]|jgi:DNA polymerase|nr:UdgX family uracil-DNA binding protein [Actinomycetota bacterium]
MTEDATDARSLIPDRPTLGRLRDAAAGCRGCGLYRGATQTVFGEGLTKAEVMLVGEQPGDQEDRRGKPFVGPAGRELDRALEEVGIDRDKVYVTNVVKHFKFTPRGKRRIHKKPNAEEIAACRPWLEAEVEVVKPRLIVALGATAAQALLGRQFRITKQHGEFFPSDLGPEITATIHPSAILRAPEDVDREQQRRLFVRDLALVARRLAG